MTSPRRFEGRPTQGKAAAVGGCDVGPREAEGTRGIDALLAAFVAFMASLANASCRNSCPTQAASRPTSVGLQPDAWVAGFAAVLKPTPRRAVARPTNTFANGIDRGHHSPRGSGFSPTPGFRDSPLCPSPRRVELVLEPRTPGVPPPTPARCRTAPGGRCSPPAAGSACR